MASSVAMPVDPMRSRNKTKGLTSLTPYEKEAKEVRLGITICKKMVDDKAVLYCSFDRDYTDMPDMYTNVEEFKTKLNSMVDDAIGALS